VLDLRRSVADMKASRVTVDALRGGEQDLGAIVSESMPACGTLFFESRLSAAADHVGQHPACEPFHVADSGDHLAVDGRAVALDDAQGLALVVVDVIDAIAV
jgi:hypothetical protein